MLKTIRRKFWRHPQIATKTRVNKIRNLPWESSAAAIVPPVAPVGAVLFTVAHPAYLRPSQTKHKQLRLAGRYQYTHEKTWSPSKICINRASKQV